MKKNNSNKLLSLMRYVGHGCVYAWLITYILFGQNLFAQSSQIQNSQGVVRVAVASNFRPTMQKLVQRFEKQANYRAVISSGSSGKLFAQINYGAGFDIFFSADQQYVQKLIKQPHLRIMNKAFTYAVGKLVLVDSNGKLPKRLSKQFLRQLMQKKKYFIAMANPRFSPYGRATKQVLATLGSSNWKPLIAENVAQAYQYVYAGHSNWGLVAQSLVLQNSSNNWRIIPMDWYQPILQDAVILKSSPAALAFTVFVQNPSSKRLIVENGYDVLD